MITLEELGIDYTMVSNIGNFYKERVLVDVLSVIEQQRPCPNREQWDDFWARHDGPKEPEYLQRGKVFRYKGRWVHAPADTEAKFAYELRRRLYQKHLADVDVLAEFGCGSGANLKQYGEMFPKVQLQAYDLSMAAVRVACQVPNVVYAEPFDMRFPTWDGFWASKAGTGMGILTHGSMEQLGENFMPFLQFLFRIKPKVVVHVEPTVEFYDETCLFDKMAAMYHRSRGYLGCYVTEIEKLGTVIEKFRTGFGNMYNEGYSVAVWRPAAA